MFTLQQVKAIRAMALVYDKTLIPVCDALIAKAEFRGQVYIDFPDKNTWHDDNKGWVNVREATNVIAAVNWLRGAIGECDDFGRVNLLTLGTRDEAVEPRTRTNRRRDQGPPKPEPPPEPAPEPVRRREGFLRNEFLDDGKGPQASMVVITQRFLRDVLTNWFDRNGVSETVQLGDRGSDAIAEDLFDEIVDECEVIDEPNDAPDSKPKDRPKQDPPPTPAEEARVLFEVVNENLDGAGLAVTDCDLLAETIAGQFGVKPEEVYSDYGGEEENEKGEGGVPWPAADVIKDFKLFDVTLKGWQRVTESPDLNEEFAEPLKFAAESLVKWVLCPNRAVLENFLVWNHLYSFVDTVSLVKNTAWRTPEQGVDVCLDNSAAVIGGDTAAVKVWKDQARYVASLLKSGGHVPVYENAYVCPDCGYTWSDTWPGQPDDDCSKCGTRHIAPASSEQTIGVEVPAED